MGSSEMDKQVKEKDSETTPGTTTTQEQPANLSPGTVNPEWSGFQGYSSVPPPGFLAPGPQGHPYMWGMQHIMPPYGSPHHPYVAMYPHGGIYAHPSIPAGSYPYGHYAMPPSNGLAETSGNTLGNTEGDGKPHAVKEKLPIKRSKGSLRSLNTIAAKDNELAKASGVSADGIFLKRAESATEGSSDESDSNSQNDSLMKKADRHGSSEVETSQNGNSMHGPQNGGSHTPQSMVNQGMAMVPYPAAAVPGTSLNIGMDYWGAPTSAPALHGKDERELKREKRKQSNRESARRSRLRKQAECDELANRAETLKEENSSLREELCRIRTEYEQLLAENASLKEKLGESPGREGTRSSKKDELSKDI